MTAGAGAVRTRPSGVLAEAGPQAGRLAPPLQPPDHRAAKAGGPAVPGGRVRYEGRAVEGRAEDRRLRHLTAIAATDAVLVDRGDGIDGGFTAGAAYRRVAVETGLL